MWAWQWPTQGNVIQGFSNSDGGNKGIDISGSRGQAVKAAASGRVVYAGNALRGYGNLIIIKHNDDFLRCLCTQRQDPCERSTRSESGSRDCENG